MMERTGRAMRCAWPMAAIGLLFAGGCKNTDEERDAAKEGGVAVTPAKAPPARAKPERPALRPGPAGNVTDGTPTIKPIDRDWARLQAFLAKHPDDRPAQLAQAQAFQTKHPGKHAYSTAVGTLVTRLTAELAWAPVGAVGARGLIEAVLYPLITTSWGGPRDPVAPPVRVTHAKDSKGVAETAWFGLGALRYNLIQAVKSRAAGVVDRQAEDEQPTAVNRMIGALATAALGTRSPFLDPAGGRLDPKGLDAFLNALYVQPGGRLLGQPATQIFALCRRPLRD